MSVVVEFKKSSSKSIEMRKKGNDLFLQNSRTNYRTVLSFYTKSIAYAPSNSEELAQSFGNRSALWLHMHKYDLCLIDIGRALSITKSNVLVDKLLSRREKCLNYVSLPVKEAEKEWELPKITPSKFVPCGSDCINVKHDEKYGYHYIATRYIRPGEIVMCEKTPFASVDFEQMYLICSHCLAFAWAGIPCKSCVFTIYCSEACKKEAWSQYHDIICELYSNYLFTLHFLRYGYEAQKLTSAGIGVGSFMTVVRMWIIFIKTEKLKHVMETAVQLDEQGRNLERILIDQSTKCRNFKSVYSLIVSNKKPDEFIGHLIPIIMSAFRKSMDTSSRNCGDVELNSMTHVFLKLYRIYEANSFKYGAYDCTCLDPKAMDCVSARGDIFAPCSARFNHSCDSNTNRIFLPGPAIVFFANRPIKKGEQLFINYGPNSSIPKGYRQMMLKENYSFSCDCLACTEDWSVDPDLKKQLEKTNAGSLVVTAGFRKMLGEDGLRFYMNPIDFNEKFFDACVIILEFIYKRFESQEALWHASEHQRYIMRYLFHVYNGDIDLHHLLRV